MRQIEMVLIDQLSIFPGGEAMFDWTNHRTFRSRVAATTCLKVHDKAAHFPVNRA
jgi:hypothetical protein